MNGAFFEELGKLAAAKSNFSVSQSRRGRRSMSVDTLLRKDKDGTLLKHKLSSAIGVQVADGEKRVLEGPAAEAQLNEIQKVLPKPMAVFRGLRGLFNPDVEEEKAAEAGWWEGHLPWYTSAAGGAAGSMIGSKVVPTKYKTLGNIGGALLGTGIGLHPGEALGRAVDKARSKEAEAWSSLSKLADSTKPQWLELPYTEGERLMQNVPVRSKSKPGDLPASADEDESYPAHKSGFASPETAISPKVGSIWKLALSMPQGVKRSLDEDSGDAPDMDSQIVKRQDHPGYEVMVGTGRAPDSKPITAVESDNTYARD